MIVLQIIGTILLVALALSLVTFVGWLLWDPDHDPDILKESIIMTLVTTAGAGVALTALFGIGYVTMLLFNLIWL